MLSWLLVYRGVLQIGNKVRIKKITPIANIYNNSLYCTAGAQYLEHQLHADWGASSTLDSVGDGCTPVRALRASWSIYERKWRHQDIKTLWQWCNIYECNYLASRTHTYYDCIGGSRKIPPTKIPPTKIPPTKIPPNENSTHVKFHPTID